MTLLYSLRLVRVEDLWLRLENSQGVKRERSDQGDRMRPRRRLGERIEMDDDWARREERWREEERKNG